jgi:hypothetical protein
MLKLMKAPQNFLLVLVINILSKCLTQIYVRTKVCFVGIITKKKRSKEVKVFLHQNEHEL